MTAAHVSAGPDEQQVDVTGLLRIGPCRALQYQFELFVPPGTSAGRALGDLVRPFRAAAPGAQPLHRYVLSHPDRHGQVVLTWDGRRMANGPIGGRDYRRQVAWHINQRVIEYSTDRFWLMHAAGVTKAGCTIIMPADQESGKTTTTAGLLREGFSYLTDEAVAVDPESLWVTPFPKTLSLDRGSWPLFPELRSRHHAAEIRQWHVPAGHLGATTADTPVPPPDLVVIPKYVGGDSTRLVRLGQAEAGFELARMTFNFRGHPGRNLEAIARLVRHATVVRLLIGSLDDAVEVVEDALSERILEAW